MKKIQAKNYKQHAPGELADILSSNSGVLVEAAINGMVELFGYIISAIGQRKKLKERISTLEAAALQQKALNEKMAQEIEYLKSKLP